MVRTAKRAGLFVVVLGALGVVGQGCLSRPVISSNPDTVTNFSKVVADKAIDKVDLLFVDR